MPLYEGPEGIKWEAIASFFIPATLGQYLPMTNGALATFAARKNEIIDNSFRQTIKYSTEEWRMRISVHR